MKIGKRLRVAAVLCIIVTLLSGCGSVDDLMGLGMQLAMHGTSLSFKVCEALESNVVDTEDISESNDCRYGTAVTFDNDAKYSISFSLKDNTLTEIEEKACLEFDPNKVDNKCIENYISVMAESVSDEVIDDYNTYDTFSKTYKFTSDTDLEVNVSTDEKTGTKKIEMKTV